MQAINTKQRYSTFKAIFYSMVFLIIFAIILGVVHYFSNYFAIIAFIQILLSLYAFKKYSNKQILKFFLINFVALFLDVLAIYFSSIIAICNELNINFMKANDNLYLLLKYNANTRSRIISEISLCALYITISDILVFFIRLIKNIKFKLKLNSQFKRDNVKTNYFVNIFLKTNSALNEFNKTKNKEILKKKLSEIKSEIQNLSLDEKYNLKDRLLDASHLKLKNQEQKSLEIINKLLVL